VVDPGSLLVFLASIALATYFLRYALVVKLGRRRRDVGLAHIYTGRKHCKGRAGENPI
jgi:hypothetical protein